MNRLREIRKERGLTQTQLAELVSKVDPTADQMMISVLERGELYPSEKLRDAICEALQCSEAELYDGVEAFFVPAVANEYSETTERLARIFGEYGYKYISRAYLCKLLDVNDRKMRKIVEKARREGFVIANAQDGNGYYLPTTYDELERLYRQNQNRAVAILAQQKHIRRKMKYAGSETV